MVEKTKSSTFAKTSANTINRMLRIENLGVRFGDTDIFTEMNLHVGKGEVVCLTGQSGCGKTTLLRAIMGFVTPYRGSVTVDGITLSPSTADTIRHQIAWMPQGLSLPTEWVNEMVRLPFNLKVNRGVRFSEEKLLEHFDTLGLEKQLLDKRLHEISGGQRQRILLAITAMQEKPIILIDEPTSALDKNSTHKALGFVQQLGREGRTVLAVSHDTEFMNGCTRIETIGK